MPLFNNAVIFPQPPPPLQIGLIAALPNDDFLYDIGAALPNEWSKTNIIVGNPAGMDPAHPGVVYGDIVTGAASMIFGQGGASQGFFLQNFATTDLEWMWQLNQSPGLLGYSNSMGHSTANGVAQATNGWSLLFSLPAGTSAQTPNANLYLSTNDGVTSQYLDTAVGLAALLGTWVKCNLRWNRAAGTITLLVNGIQAAQTTLRIPTAGTSVPLFEYNSFLGGAIPAGTRHLFDYVKLTATVGRS